MLNHNPPPQVSFTENDLSDSNCDESKKIIKTIAEFSDAIDNEEIILKCGRCNNVISFKREHIPRQFLCPCCYTELGKLEISSFPKFGYIGFIPNKDIGVTIIQL